MASSNSGGALASAPRPDKKARRRAPAHLTPASLEAAALRYLERYASSAENLRRVLLRRVRRADAGEDGVALVEALVERYRAAGLLDDARYAAGRAASLHRRGASRRGIASRLAAKGVAGETIAQALAGLADEADDSELAAACAFVRRRRLGPFRSAAARQAAHDKDLASLARAGFELATARRALACADPAALDALAAAAREGAA